MQHNLIIDISKDLFHDIDVIYLDYDNDLEYGYVPFQYERTNSRQTDLSEKIESDNRYRE